MTHISALEPTVKNLNGRRSEILEIGSFEGLSACFFLWRLPEARLTCIDTFAGSVEHVAYGQSVKSLEERFDQNVARVDPTRVRKIRGDSRRVLIDLAEESAHFDLVYVDGSHLALDVLVDAALAWPLVRLGGRVIFDDYRWRGLGHDSLMRPGPAIDAFLKIVDDHGEVLVRDSQVVVRRRS